MLFSLLFKTIILMKKTVLFFFLLIFCYSCKKHEKVSIVKSFCYWKTEGYFNSEDDSLIKKMDVKHMYLRLFDVDWNPYIKEAQPIATISNIGISDNLQLTPSVFITNDVLLHSSKLQLDQLSQRISTRISQVIDQYVIQTAKSRAYKISENDYNNQEGNTIMSRLNEEEIVKTEKPKIEKLFQEILFDCDWYESTRDNYFYLLKKLKAKLPKYKIEATIRLWQYKYYEKAGIPPVDKGLLMCYNMSNVKEYNANNSIGSSKELSEYITHDNYPLRLDVALPLFSWSVLFRGGIFKGVISDIDDFDKNKLLFSKISENKYQLQDDILLGNFYARNGDEIRIEKISDEEIENMIHIIKDKIKIDNSTKVTFFSFDKKYINDYGIQNISKYYSNF